MGIPVPVVLGKEYWEKVVEAIRQTGQMELADEIRDQVVDYLGG